MTTLIEKQEEIRLLKSEIVNHCMCSYFIDDVCYYRVYFPKGYKTDGVQCEKSIGKIKALKKILYFCEKNWKDELL